MNWLLLVVVILIAGNMLWGYKVGFLRVVYSLIEWILVLLFVMWSTPYVCTFLQENTGIVGYIEERYMEQMKNSVTGDTAGLETGTTPEASVSGASELIEALEIAFPNALEKAFEGSGELADEVLEQTGVYERLARELALLTVKGLSYLLTLVLAGVIFRILGQTLKVVDKIPLINGINRMIGILAGFIKGMAVVWILFALIAVFMGTEIGRFFLPYINEASILMWLYKTNPILDFLFA